MSIGNLKTEGSKGTNYGYQNMVLLSLDRIATVVGATTTEFEAQLVLDNASVVWLEVRVYNQETGAFDPPVYFPPGSSTPGAPTLPVTYLAPAAPEAKSMHLERTAGVVLTIPPGASSISVANVGAATGRVDIGSGNVNIDTGETISFDAGATNNTLGSMDIDDVGGGTQFLVIWIT